MSLMHIVRQDRPMNQPLILHLSPKPHFKAVSMLLTELFIIFLIFFLFEPSVSLAEEISLNNFVPLNPNLTYNLEVAKDEFFQRVIIKKNVQGKNLTFMLNEEYAYFWKLTPHLSSMGTAESSASASGSFVFLKSGRPIAEHPVIEKKQIEWDPYPEATEYRITISDLNTRPRSIMRTTSHSALLPRSPYSVLIFIEPYKMGGGSLFDTFSVLPGLKLARDKNADKVVVLKPEPQSTEESLSKVASGAAPGPEVSVLPEVNPGPTEASPEEFQKPWHRLSFYEAYFFDTLKLTRGTAKISLDDQAFGGGFSLHTQPIAGFYITAQADYHDIESITNIEGTESALSDFGFKAPRVNVSGGLGIDVLGFIPNGHHHLGLRAAGGLISLPFLPEEDSLENLTIPPKISSKQVPLAGGGLGYRFFTKNLSLGLDYSFLVSEKRNSEISTGQLSLEFYIAKGISVLLAFQGRQIHSKICAEDKAQCEAIGTVNTRVIENAVIAGIGNYRH